MNRDRKQIESLGSAKKGAIYDSEEKEAHIQLETMEACAKIVHLYGTISESGEARQACYEIADLLVKLAASSSAEELLALCGDPSHLLKKISNQADRV